jgi:hypothetical protein
MGIPSKQIGWSQEANLYYNILKQLNRLTAVMSKVTLEPSAPIIPSVTICDQTWSLYNLDVETYRNGDPIPQVTDGTAWANLTTGAWCYYLNSSANGVVYGKLYNWYAVNDPRGLAPEGWHIPSLREFNYLISQTLDNNLNDLKEGGTAHWTTATTSTNLNGKTLRRILITLDISYSLL